MISKIRNTEVMAGEAGYGEVFFLVPCDCSIGVGSVSSISGEWGWEESPCAALSCYDLSSDQFSHEIRIPAPEPTRIQ